MKKRTRCSLIAAVLAPLLLEPAPVVRGAEASAEPRTASEILATLTWLAGRWEERTSGGASRISYSTPDGGFVLSHGELERGGQVAHHRFEEWRVSDGRLCLFPYPEGKPGEGYFMSSWDAKARTITFVNSARDFPQRLTYQRVSDTRLTITKSSADETPADPAGMSHEGPSHVEITHFTRLP